MLTVCAIEELHFHWFRCLTVHLIDVILQEIWCLVDLTALITLLALGILVRPLVIPELRLIFARVSTEATAVCLGRFVVFWVQPEAGKLWERTATQLTQVATFIRVQLQVLLDRLDFYNFATLKARGRPSRHFHFVAHQPMAVKGAKVAIFFKTICTLINWRRQRCCHRTRLHLPQYFNSFAQELCKFVFQVHGCRVETERETSRAIITYNFDPDLIFPVCEEIWKLQRVSNCIERIIA